VKPLEYYWAACPKHPDRVWIKVHGMEGALCEVHPFNGQTAEECAMGLVLLLTTFASAIQNALKEGGSSCDEAQRG